MTKDRHGLIRGRLRLVDQAAGDLDSLREISLHRQRDAQPESAVPREEPVAQRVGEVTSLLRGRNRGDRFTGIAAHASPDS